MLNQKVDSNRTALSNPCYEAFSVMKHSVLIVDDELGIRESLSGVLQDEGYRAEAVESGETCLDVLAKRTFNVVMLDIWLPGMDGLETLEKIGALENPPTAPLRPLSAPRSSALSTLSRSRFRLIRPC